MALLQFTLVFGQTDVQNKATSSSPLAEQKQSLPEAHSNLIRKNDSFLTGNREKIFSQELEHFNLIIDSLEQTVQKLVKKYEGNFEEIDSQIIDSLLTETKFKHRRYRLLYPQNYHRFSGFNKKATVSSDYFENVMKGSFNTPSLLLFKEYRKCMNFYFDILSAGEYKFSHLEYVPVKRLDNRYDAIVELDAQQSVKDFFIKEHFTSNIWTYRVEAFDYAFAKVLDDVKNPAYVKEIKDTYKMGKDRRNDASEIKVYKTVNGITLNAHIFYPKNHDKSQAKPAHLFFHGGGWAIGLPEWSYGACKGSAEEGRVAITFDYRLRNIHGTDVKASVSDALTAIAWVRENAKELGIDPNKVLADGFSAGAHLALVSSMIENPEYFGVTSKYSSKPDAIILGSCPYDIAGRDVYNINYDTRTISPLYLMDKNLPPILAFHGEDDGMVKFSEFEKFRDAIQKTKNSFTSRSYAGAGHFYFRGSSQKDSDERRRLTEEFLLKNGFKVE
ncbi:alpha/beta hydrolase [Aquimarina sp. 2201CG5-10]|uniref:alpha/beta hydrolase n=1 Tax=Aquimarina callyspongiae TaxID=3098150 RepID=UPI002AB5B1CC|nr:alpha/beta hydrolase [Aquimarina sp. 2201CG5-10]MDY8137452.1 alpha/beta hydrolase [Aquimarina sp. 2201CG5-10]